jgi:hypothetical protein
MFKKPWDKIRDRLREPVLSDRRLDIAAAISWILIGVWGVASAAAGQTIVTRVAGQDYGLPWGLSLGLFGLIAGIAAASTMVGLNRISMIIKESIELITLSMLTGTLSVVTLLRGVAIFTEGLSATTIASFAITAFFLVFPTWRIFHLTERIRVLRKLTRK